MTYERLKQFLILSICSVLLLGLIADEARAALCLDMSSGVHRAGEVYAFNQSTNSCTWVDETKFNEGDKDNAAGGYIYSDDDSAFTGVGQKTFSEWVMDDIKRGRNDDEFCTNVVEKIDGVICGDDGRYVEINDGDKYVPLDRESGMPYWEVDFNGYRGYRNASSLSEIPGMCSRPDEPNYCVKEWKLNSDGTVYSGFAGRYIYYRLTGKTSNCPEGSFWDDNGCLLESSEPINISNDDLAKKFNDLDMSDFDKMLSSPAFDQYMDELEKIGIHWTGKLETEKKKVEEKTDYHPDGSQSLTELYESKEYSYDGQTNSNNNKLYPTQEKTHSTTVVDGKTTSSGTSTRPGKGANSDEPGNGSGDGDGPLDAKVDGSQIGLGESPEIPELYQQKYKNTDWAEIVEDGLQDNPMLDNLKGIGSQYTTGVCPSFEQEFFGELIVIDVPCELLDMIRAFFLTISSISAFWIIFRRA